MVALEWFAASGSDRCSASVQKGKPMLSSRISFVRALLSRIVLIALGYVAFALLHPASPALAAPGPIDADVTNGSGSFPELNNGGTDWEAFDVNQGIPAKGGITVLYTPQDLADLNSFPIQASGATVTLRPSATAADLNCTFSPAEPVLSSSTAGQCFFRVTGAGDGIQIFYLGQFQPGGDIRYTISGLDPAAGGSGTFTNFDSDNAAPGQAPTPSAGRDPARLVLVLDKSGSMLWSSHPQDPGCGVFTTPPPGCEPQRWEVLGDAVEQMLVVAEAYALPTDVFAAALFDGRVLDANRFDFTTIDPTSVDAFLDDLATRTPSGSTSIGAGVEEFRTELSSPGTFTQTILVFTDGDQNTAPFLVTNATQVLINPAANSPVGAGVAEFVPGVVRLCPFALRADSPSGLLGSTYLQEIADRRCEGIMNTTVSVDPGDPELIQFFLQVLNDTLVGDKLEMASVQDGQITESGAPTTTVEFTTSADDVSFTVLINWAERFNGLIDAELVKDGVVIPLISPPVIEIASSGGSYVLTDEGENYFSATLRQPFCNDDHECVDPAGEWVLRFRPFFEVGDTFTYNVFVIVDNASIASEFRASQSPAGVGEPLLVEARLSEGGAPLTGLADGSVRAIVARPDAGLGNVLSLAKVDPVDNSEDDDISAAGRKASAMLNDPALRDELLAALEAGLASEVTLTEGEPGVYTAVYTDTVVEGVYLVNVFVDGETTRNGRFTRTFETGHYIEVVPDPSAVEASMVITPFLNCTFAGGCFSILVTPVDRLGNLLGPGKDPLFHLPLDSKAQLIEPAIDNLDGTYEIRIGFAEEIQENPTVQIGEVSVRPEIIPPPPPPPPDKPKKDNDDDDKDHSKYCRSRSHCKCSAHAGKRHSRLCERPERKGSHGFHRPQMKSHSPKMQPHPKGRSHKDSDKDHSSSRSKKQGRGLRPGEFRWSGD